MMASFIMQLAYALILTVIPNGSDYKQTDLAQFVIWLI